MELQGKTELLHSPKKMKWYYTADLVGSKSPEALRSQIDLNRLTPLTHGSARAPTLHGVGANAFTSAATVKISA